MYSSSSSDDDDIQDSPRHRSHDAPHLHTKGDADVFPRLVCSLHEAFANEIEVLCENNLHTQVATSEYLKRHLLSGQRRFLESLHPPRASSPGGRRGHDGSHGRDNGYEQSCDFGKLHDIKAVFDNFSLICELLKRRSSAVPSSSRPQGKQSIASRVQSAPSASAKLTQMQLGLHHSTRGPDATSGAAPVRSARDAVGVPERIVLERIAPIMCATYPKGTASWYNSIDTNSAGSVTWTKFARFLQTYYEAVHVKAQRAATLSQHVRYEEIPLGRLQRGPPFRATQVRDSCTTFYLLCTDGCVRAVSKETLKVVDVVHYADPHDPHPIDIKFQPDRNQLYVALPNGFVFVYDTSGHLTRQGNITRAFRIGQEHPYHDRGWDKGGGIAVMQKLTKFDPLHMQLPDNGSRFREIPTAIVTNCDVFPLSLHAHCRCGASRMGLCVCGGLGVVARGQLTSIDPVQEVTGSKDQNFFAGFEHGHVALYKPPAVCPVVAAPRKAALITQPHTDRITCLRYCSTFPDLRGLLTSSEGGHLSLLDVDTSEVIVTFRDQYDDSAILSDGGGWINGCRPVHAFDVSHQMPIIASCGHMRGVSLWSATMRRKLCTFQDHRGPVHSICFNQSTFHLVSIGGDRTLRIWDIRTMKAVQVIVDRERIDSQPFGVVSYDATEGRIVAWTGAPYVFPLVDDHVASRTAKDLNPVTCMLIVEDELQKRMVVCSGTSVSLWDLSSGALELVLDVGAHIELVALDPSGKKLFMAIPGSVIVQYVVGSQVLSGRTQVAMEDNSEGTESLLAAPSSPRANTAGISSPRRRRPASTTTARVVITSMSFVQKTIGRSRRRQHGVVGCASPLQGSRAENEPASPRESHFSASSRTEHPQQNVGPSFLLLGTSCGAIAVMSDRLGGTMATPLQVFRVDHALEAYNKAQRKRNLDRAFAKLARQHNDDPDDVGNAPHSPLILDACGEVTALEHTTTPYGDFVIAGTSGGVVAIVCLEYDGNMVLQKIDQHRSLMGRFANSPSRATSPSPDSLGGGHSSHLGSSKAPTMTGNDPAKLVIHHAQPAIPPRSSSAPLSKTAVLWKRAVSATRKEREDTLNARSFTQFRYSAQERMQMHIDGVAILRALPADDAPSPTPPSGVSGQTTPFGLPLASSGEAVPELVAPLVHGKATSCASDTHPNATPPSPANLSSSLTAYTRRLQTDASEEPVFLITLTASGDCKVMCASTRSSLEENAIPELIGSFPGTTSDGCGGQLAADGECVWVADDSGHLSEFRVCVSTVHPSAVLKGGCKYSTRVFVELVHVTRYACGIRAIALNTHSNIIVLGLESGRSSALRLEDRSHLWGQAPVDDHSLKELLLKHRFQFAFRPVGDGLSPRGTSPLPANRRFQGVAKVVSRMLALRQPEAKPLELHSVHATAAATATAQRDAYLALAMRGAPPHLRKGVVATHDDDTEKVVTAKAASLRFRDRSDEGKDDPTRSCFSRLKLNDVSGVLLTRPSSAAPPVTMKLTKKR